MNQRYTNWAICLGVSQCLCSFLPLENSRAWAEQPKVSTVSLSSLGRNRAASPMSGPTGSGPSGSATESAVRLNERGVEAVLKGDNKRGLQHLREGIKLDPGNPTIHYNLAGLFLNEGKISEALVEVNRCVAARPDDLSFLHRLGEVHFAAENFADAAEIFERIAEKNPEFNEVLFHLGTVYAMQKRWDKAESVLKRSLELYPSHVSLETNLANVLIMREKFSEASALLEKVNESEPSPEVSQTMGIAYEGKGELKKALQSYEKAVEQGSKDPQLSGRIEEIKKKIASKS